MEIYSRDTITMGFGVSHKIRDIGVFFHIHSYSGLFRRWFRAVASISTSYI